LVGFGEWRFAGILTDITYRHLLPTSLTDITYRHHLPTSLTYYGFSAFKNQSLTYIYLPTMVFQHSKTSRILLYPLIHISYTRFVDRMHNRPPGANTMNEIKL